MLILNACATYKTQYGRAITQPTLDNSNKIEKEKTHRFYLIGDAGNADDGESKTLFQYLKLKLSTADSAATLLFLGDNIYPKGMPNDLDSIERKLAEKKLQFQIDLGKEFAGKTIFIPGNHDWYNGLIGLKAQEKFVNQHLGENSFLPKNSCGIDYLDINESTLLITIDSQWFLENWDKHKKINANCNIKTREDFFKEFEKLLNQNQNKLCLVALHHPLVSNGQHGGQFSLKDQLFPLEPKIPLPFFGSFGNFIRKTSGIISQDTQHPVYRNFTNRMKTLLKDRDNVVFISGHEHSLQYIEIENLKQIISGSGSKTGAARAIHKNDFSYGGLGYAVLDVFENGQSSIQFYGIENGKENLLFEHLLTNERTQASKIEYPQEFPAFENAQIYPNQWTQKNKSYQFLLGNHYRSYYSLPVQTPVLNLNDFK